MSAVTDYAALASLRESGASFSVRSMDLTTRKLRDLPGSVVYFDHTSVVQLVTATARITCPISHRVLTTSLRYPFDMVPAHCLAWIKVSDVLQGMFIAVAADAPLQPERNQGHATPGSKIRWEPVRFIKPMELFECYGVQVQGGDNYVMSGALNKSYG